MALSPSSRTSSGTVEGARRAQWALKREACVMAGMPVRSR